MKVGGRGQWRVGRTDLEAFIAHAYADTRTFVDQHPFGINKDAAGEDENPDS